MPEFAVVVINYRTPELTRRCVELARADSPAELLVVDNASGDTAGLAGLPLLARETNDGFAAAVNAGVAATTAPIVVVLNADIEPRPGALRALAAHLDAVPRCGVAAPRLLNPDGSVQPSAFRRAPGLAQLAVQLSIPLSLVTEWVPALDRHTVHDWAPGQPVAHAIGAALAIRRDAFAAAGPFDEGFFLYLEETEWQARVVAAGYTVELVPDAEIVHLIRGGGEAALAPSPHFVTSARRYLALRGYRPRTVNAVLGAALLSSRVFARLWERLRDSGGARVRGWDALR